MILSSCSMPCQSTIACALGAFTLSTRRGARRIGRTIEKRSRDMNQSRPGLFSMASSVNLISSPQRVPTQPALGAHAAAMNQTLARQQALVHEVLYNEKLQPPSEHDVVRRESILGSVRAADKPPASATRHSASATVRQRGQRRRKVRSPEE